MVLLDDLLNIFFLGVLFLLSRPIGFLVTGLVGLLFRSGSLLFWMENIHYLELQLVTH